MAAGAGQSRAPARSRRRESYPETHGFPVYNAWSPRLSLVYDLTGIGRVALKASYGRYAASGSGVNNAAGPVASSVNPAATLVSTYTRWDGRIPYTPVAADLTSVTGRAATRGSIRRSRASISTSTPAASTLACGATRRFGSTSSASATIAATRCSNLAQPFEAFTDVVNGVDPGRDNVTGTADDGVVQV